MMNAEFAAWLEEARIIRKTQGRPLVSLCYAQSLDGSLSVDRRQPLTLSGPETMKMTHELRAAHQAILVGIGTVLSDDPRLTVRLVDGQDPIAVVLDSRLRIPPAARMLQQRRSPVWIATTGAAEDYKRQALEAEGGRVFVFPADSVGRVSLIPLLRQLAALGIDSLMVEGGAGVLSAFLSQQLADLVCITIAPLFIGGLNIFNGRAPGLMELPGTPLSTKLGNVSYQRCGEDLVVFGRLASPVRTG